MGSYKVAPDESIYHYYLLGSWDNLLLSDEILTFLGTLFNINPAKLLPKYPKKYPSDYFTQVPNSSDSNDESNSNNRDSLIPNDDESNVLDDDKNVWQTFDIPLKIKSLFQLIYYNIHNGKKKTPLHIMNLSAIYEKSKSRELLTFSIALVCVQAIREQSFIEIILQSLLLPEAVIQEYHYQSIFRKVSLP